MRKRNRYFIIILSIVAFTAYPFYAALTLTERKNSTQENRNIERPEAIKKKHNKDYKSGIYRDTKKDYVKNWIDEDIDYQKKIIKLKSDYRSWAIDKIDREKNVDYKEYISLKTYSETEKKILLDYHNKIFNNMMFRKSRSAKSNPETGSRGTKKITKINNVEPDIKSPTQVENEIIAPVKPDANDSIQLYKPFIILIVLIIIAGYYLINKKAADKTKI